MASKRDGVKVEWAKHLRRWGKKAHHKKVRAAAARDLATRKGE